VDQLIDINQSQYLFARRLFANFPLKWLLCGRQFRQLNVADGSTALGRFADLGAGLRSFELDIQATDFGKTRLRPEAETYEWQPGASPAALD